MSENGSSVPYEAQNRGIDREYEHSTDVSIEAQSAKASNRERNEYRRTWQFSAHPN
jgi:hypothetical protein